MTIKIGINGMGRIGRMVIRAIIESKNKNILIKHINNRSSSEICCSLLKNDSIHQDHEKLTDRERKSKRFGGTFVLRSLTATPFVKKI